MLQNFSFSNIRNNKIAFIGMKHFDSSSQNWLECFNLGQSNIEDLFCSLNQNVTFENDSGANALNISGLLV